MKQTIINTLKGVAIGDAFGVGLEFKSRFWIKENVHFDKFLNTWIEWNGKKNNIMPGAYSDDTEHTFGVIEALLSRELFFEELLLSKFKHEYEYDKEKKGFSRDGHGSIEKWYKGEQAIDEVRKEQAVRADPGNGPIMRCVPLIFIPLEKRWDYCYINAHSTHPGPVAYNSTLLAVVTGWHFLRNNGNADNLLEYLIGFFNEYFQIKKQLQILDKLPAPDKLSEKDFLILHGEQPIPYIKFDTNVYGCPGTAMKTALNVVYILKHSSSAFDALKNSINMGGDVDSLAAVSVGIAAGKYGLDSLPQFLLEQTEGLERMEILAGKLYEKFKAEY
ncbi:MAG: ADP-ribosylglycohydrolase family protein [Candidatus Nomurabacteria bacterium]|nr:ADP-ribosylglycohydrolase family protein [Candidatus Nomurabacteria bacterium]